MKEKNSLKSLIFRYVFLALVALPGLKLFYFIFLPLTLYPVYFLLGLLMNVSLAGNVILANNFPIEIVGACVAGAAYYLLLILNLSVPSITFTKRLKMILLSFVTLLVINILRIFFLSLMYVAESPLFDLAHKILWYFGSTIFILLIWFLEVKIFKIKGIPFYSDLKMLYKKSSLKKK